MITDKHILIHDINICDIDCLIEHQVVNIVNLKAICLITNCHSIYYSIILTFNGKYRKIKLFIGWCLNIMEAIFENLRTKNTYKNVLFLIESCQIQRYIILFLKPETLDFQKNTSICPQDWYQLTKFWLLRRVISLKIITLEPWSCSGYGRGPRLLMQTRLSPCRDTLMKYSH